MDIKKIIFFHTLLEKEVVCNTIDEVLEKISSFGASEHSGEVVIYGTTGEVQHTFAFNEVGERELKSAIKSYGGNLGVSSENKPAI
jgi:hypothetical protein